MQDQPGSEYLKIALGKGPLFHLNPQDHHPPQLEVGLCLGLGVTLLVVGLYQLCGSQQAGQPDSTNRRLTIPHGDS